MSKGGLCLKLILQQTEVATPEVEIRYKELDERVKQVVWHVKNIGYTLTGSENGRDYQVSPFQILYIETVDRKTFIYTDKHVYRTDKKLKSLLLELEVHGFVQVSRTTIANLSKMESMRSLANSRLEALLSNGERIEISRTYLAGIKEALQNTGGCL